MFSLQKYHIDSSNLTDEADIKKYNDAYRRAVILSASANLFAAEVLEVVEKIIDKYKIFSLQRIGVATVNVPWSREKRKHATALLLFLEEVDITLHDGKAIKDSFISQVKQWGEVYLPSMQDEFFKNDAISKPGPGKLEETFLQIIIDSIEIIYQVYSLYQVHDKTRYDFRMQGEGSDEAFALLWTALDKANKAVRDLLGDFKNETLNKSKGILSTITAQHAEVSVISAASNLKPPMGRNAVQGISSERLLHVNKLFTEHLYQNEVKDLQSAMASFLVTAKVGLTKTLSTARYYLGAAAKTCVSWANKAYDYSHSATQDEDSDEDNCFCEEAITTDSRPRPPSDARPGKFISGSSLNLRDDYIATATGSPVLTAAPLASSSRTGDLIDLQDEPASKTSTHSPV